MLPNNRKQAVGMLMDHVKRSLLSSPLTGLLFSSCYVSSQIFNRNFPLALFHTSYRNSIKILSIFKLSFFTFILFKCYRYLFISLLHTYNLSQFKYIEIDNY